MSLNKLLLATALMVSVSGVALAADPAPADNSAAAPAKVVKKKHHHHKKAAAPAAAPAEGSAK